MRIILLALSMACTSDKSLNVNNSAPTATFTSHDEADTVTEGTTVLFSAALSDADDAVETLQARWFADDVEQCGLGAPDEVGDSSCSIWIEAGMHEIKVEVRDPSNAVGFGVYWLSIIQTNPPEVEILSPTAEEEYQASSSISFEAVASDSEDASDQLTIAWNSSLDGDQVKRISILLMKKGLSY